MSAARLEYLFDCFVHNCYSGQEKEELMALLAKPENQVALQKLIDRVIENTGPEMRMTDQSAASILQNILQKDRGLVIPAKSRKTVFSFWMRTAAAAILFLAATAYWIIDRKKDVGEKLAEKHTQILPGGNRALLTTSDGSTVVLDSAKNGTLIQQGSTKINKQGGLLIYYNVPDSSKTHAPVVYSTLSTPRGGQYQVLLSDGTKVWLNAASSLHFPSAFTGGQRVVELTGEAYFEVARNKEKPFQVKVGNMRVNVLGTHFNVKAYADENELKTSLLEGSVRITADHVSGLLRPGQQAVLDKNEDMLEVTYASMDEVMAWKNGLFQFEGADISTIMREIGRWYDVDVEYAGKLPVQRFEGKISRNAQLSEVLQILELSNVRFSVKGTKIIVQ